MTRSSFFSAVLFASLCILSLLGCSLLKDVSAEQCQTDNECKRFGVYVCSADNVCVPSNTGGSGGSTGLGGGAGTVAGAGSGGMSSTPECVENADCIASHSGAPYICQSGACVSLTSEGQCPFAIAGTDADATSYLTQPGKPIIIGAYVPIGVAGPKTHPYTLTYQFALEEFMSGTLGGIGTPHRPVVLVLCQSTQPDLKASVDHLVNTLNVPAILATLPSTDLAAAFDLVTATGHKVFLLGPFEADNNLAAADDKGLMWHMLGPTTDLIPAYAPLLKKIQTYLETNGRAGPHRVAVINNDLSWSKDMAAAFPSAVQVNGAALSAKANASNYLPFQVKVANGASLDVSAVVGALSDQTSTVDIIVSLGGSEFMSAILPKIQAGRKDSSHTPFYVLSPDNAFDNNLNSLSYFMPAQISATVPLSAGVNYASVLDDSLYQSYLAAIKARFPGVSGLESRENLYDAAYYMFYSLAEAAHGAADFDGSAVADGMTHLVKIGGEPATVGPGTDGGMIAHVMTTINGGFDIELTGALGPPTFNLSTGARKSQGSVWCINYKLPAPPSVRFDAMRLSSSDMTMLEIPTGGSFCYPNF